MTKYLVKEHKNFTTLFSMRVCIIKLKKKKSELLGSQKKKEETVKFQNFHYQKEMENVNSSRETQT